MIDNQQLSSEPILVVNEDSGVLSVTLNRPDSANALSPELVEALLNVFNNSGNCRLCIIRGNGQNFCAGFDLSDIEELSDGDLLWRFLRIETLLQIIYHAKFPVIAFAHGHVVGAGADLFAACWQRIASADTKIKMPGWNFELALGTRRLKNLIGADAARDLLIDTKTLYADDAQKCGLINQIEETERWPEIVDGISDRTKALPLNALNQMFSITATDTRSEDLASIVKTAGYPGLKARVLDYRSRLNSAKRESQP